MLAAADMAISKLSWVCSWRRMSTSTVARPCQGSSSWRIMISSRRAVEGQCTPEVVTDLVLADGVELLACKREGAGVRRAPGRVGAGGVGQRGDGVDVREHGED